MTAGDEECLPGCSECIQNPRPRKRSGEAEGVVSVLDWTLRANRAGGSIVAPWDGSPRPGAGARWVFCRRNLPSESACGSWDHYCWTGGSCRSALPRVVMIPRSISNDNLAKSTDPPVPCSPVSTQYRPSTTLPCSKENPGRF